MSQLQSGIRLTSSVRAGRTAGRALALLAAGVVLAGACLTGVSPAGDRPAPPALPESGSGDVAGEVAENAAAPRIQLAILLDTSGSMSGLINQARTQLWKIVNELAATRQNGQPPQLEVALYEYGKSSIPASEGFLRQIAPLTEDLDLISAELFALTTNGGQEYCGHVISAATTGLKWTKGDRDLRLIFIAGNEGFEQGAVDYREACGAAIARGITVSTIYCGTDGDAVSAGWKDGAKLADGSYLSIDQNQAVAEVRTPFDEQLAKLSGSLNGTFIRYGQAEKRALARTRQAAQDRLSREAAPAAAAERAKFKASAQYRSAGDLVEAVQTGKVKLQELKPAELPEELQKLSEAELKKAVEQKGAERAALQKQIRELSEKRDRFIAEERARQAEATGKETFDGAVLRAVRQQAARRGYVSPQQPGTKSQPGTPEQSPAVPEKATKKP